MEFRIALIGDYIYGDEELIKKCDFNESPRYVLKKADAENLITNKKTIPLKDPVYLSGDK